MIKNPKFINAEDLMYEKLPKLKYCVDTLIPEGVMVLAGASKIGKSWMVLDLVTSIANGTEFLGFNTMQGKAIYFCFEDTKRRIQDRLYAMNKDNLENAILCFDVITLDEGLCDVIREKVKEDPTTRAVVIDVFQKIRDNDKSDYAYDYADVCKLKAVADELGITIIIVHHVRKEDAKDIFNKITGSTGIVAAADGSYLLDREERSSNIAKLVCTGRDIEYRELKLSFEKTTCRWEVLNDSYESPEIIMQDEMVAFLNLMKRLQYFKGTNTELAEQYTAYAKQEITPKALKQMMNRNCDKLEEQGLFFKDSRSNGQRFVEVFFSADTLEKLNSDVSDVNDAKSGGPLNCVSCVPCVPESKTEQSELKDFTVIDDEDDFGCDAIFGGTMAG